MYLIELFAPAGALDADRRREAAERVLTAMSTYDGATPESSAAIRRIWRVVVHEPVMWMSGADAGYVVRVSMPTSSATSEGARGYLITTITRALTEVTGAEADVVVHVVEVPEGGAGFRGAAVREADIVRMIMGDAPSGPAVPVAPGADTAVDPVCGMTVSPVGSVPTLEHDGDIYAFCCDGCRDVYAERLAAAV
jgi:YHS domain-containing protein/phenylpyruvate tautomerase PptA (4-oxalocrotonate tautomerase family)